MELCNKFREYLLNARQLKRDGYITRNSAPGYWFTFRGFLKILYLNRLIKANINDFLENIGTQIPMKEWIRSAGITKNTTFHSYRRTFAILQGAAGTDIRTIQSMMAHKSITTTQRYMKVVDSNKREASNKITLKRKE